MLCFSQNPINFADPYATWNVAKTFPNANPQNPGFVETTTKVHGFMGDTVIASETWLKFYATSDSNFMEGFNYLGSLREENGLVLFMDTLNLLDTIYNFNLQSGDSVFFDFGWESAYLKIESIDSLEIEGEFYKRFFFEEPNFGFFYMDEVWIEGIGSIHGPLFPKYPTIFSEEIPDSLNLTCFKKDNSIIWNNPFYDLCYVSIILSSEEINIETFEIFPNPTTELLNIKYLNNSKISSIEIINMHGKTVIYQKISNDLNKIDVRELDPGTYFARVFTDKGVAVNKIIKQ